MPNVEPLLLQNSTYLAAALSSPTDVLLTPNSITPSLLLSVLWKEAFSVPLSAISGRCWTFLHLNFKYIIAPSTIQRTGNRIHRYIFSGDALLDVAVLVGCGSEEGLLVNVLL